MQKTIQLKKAF